MSTDVLALLGFQRRFRPDDWRSDLVDGPTETLLSEIQKLCKKAEGTESQLAIGSRSDAVTWLTELSASLEKVKARIHTIENTASSAVTQIDSTIAALEARLSSSAWPPTGKELATALRNAGETRMVEHGDFEGPVPLDHLATTIVPSRAMLEQASLTWAKNSSDCRAKASTLSTQMQVIEALTKRLQAREIIEEKAEREPPEASEPASDWLLLSESDSVPVNDLKEIQRFARRLETLVASLRPAQELQHGFDRL